MSTFPERLHDLRVKADISQSFLAARIGLSKSSINMYERGEREPSLEMCKKLANYFGVTLDYLLGRTDDPLDGAGTPADGAYVPPENEPPLTPEKLKFALFGDANDITDEDLEDVMRYAEFVRARKKAKKNG